jgi:hypothetical protein
MVRLATREHDRETTKSQVQNLKRSEALISQELRRITNEKQAAQSEKEQDNGIQRKEMPPKRSISPDFIFEIMEVITGHKAISPDHNAILSQTTRLWTADYLEKKRRCIQQTMEVLMDPTHQSWRLHRSQLMEELPHSTP